jgi:hypothetical protein
MAIGLSIFWSLPFSEKDEEEMRARGYGDAWIRFMRAMHNQNHRCLITHEIAGQASAIGLGVDDAYKNNGLFREVFSEIIPDRSCKWNNSTKYQPRLPGGDPTTGTYEYRGVGQALQGIHVNSQINDDNVGREAQQSVLRGDGRVMTATINWWQQAGTRFDPAVGKARRHLVVGNPWCHSDLNDWIAKNMPEFAFETHDAEGGCCTLHPKGKPILPSVWPIELLHRERDRLEAAGQKNDYLHFYRCMHILPGERLFDLSWIRYFKYKQSRPGLLGDDPRNILLLEHEPFQDGDETVVLPDFQPGTLTMCLIVDPKHAKKTKRTQHVIWVVGYDTETMRVYLLSLWAEDCGYTEVVQELYRTARRWLIATCYMGALAKELLNFYLQQEARTQPLIRTRTGKFPLDVSEFPDDASEAGVKNRIEALEPLFRGKQIWAQRNQGKFLTEVENYPAGKIDTLDVLGNFTNTVDLTSGSAVDGFLREQQRKFASRNVGAGGF